MRTLLFTTLCFLLPCCIYAQSASLVGESSSRVNPANPSMSLGNTSFTYQIAPKARAFREQDLIKVQVLTSFNSKNTADLQRQKKIKAKMKITEMFRIKSLFDFPEPLETAPPEIGTEIDSQNRSKGSVTTKQSVQFTMQCKIVSVLENGTLQIEGTETQSVGEDSKTITISGIVRPEDITAGNTVSSSDIYGFSLVVVPTGLVNDSIRRSYGTQFLDRWMPF